MTPDALPPEAIDAAVKANDAFFDADGDIKHPPNTWVHELARVMLEAAAPHLAAAEREACAQLAEQVDAQYPWYHAAGGIQQPVAFRPFAALLREARP